MDLLIIGGSGFVSGTMVRDALEAGHRVWALSRGNKPVPDGATPLVADRHDPEAFARAIAEAHVHWNLVVDCIGFTADDAQQDLQTLSDRANHLVFISTDMVISGVDRPWRIDETYARFDQNPYGANKRAAEQVLIDAGVDALPWTILRPGHIYGPGSQPGCLPHHGRDGDLLEKMAAGQPLQLVGGGHFLQQPIFVHDLAAMAFSCLGNPRASGEIYFAPGPDILASWRYYRIIADVLGVALNVTEAPISAYLAAHPQRAGFCCHRVYDDAKARAHGLAMPATPIAEGLARHVHALQQA
jgi:nucleoside-diphosphate-sugar epimerase